MRDTVNPVKCENVERVAPRIQLSTDDCINRFKRARLEEQERMRIHKLRRPPYYGTIAEVRTDMGIEDDESEHS